MLTWFKSAYRWLILRDLDPDVADPVYLAKTWHLYNIMLAVLVFGGFYLFKSIQLGVVERVISFSICVPVAALCLFANGKRQHMEFNACLAILMVSIIILISNLTNGGMEGPVYNVIIVPLIAGLLLGRRAAVGWTIVVLLFITGMFVYQQNGGDIPNLNPPEQQANFEVLNYFLFPLIMLSIIGAYLQAVTIANDKYQRSIEQLTEQVKQTEKAEAQAVEASAVKSQFLANMSHELRTPLNAILGFTQLMRGLELSKQNAEYVEKVEYSGRLLLEVVNDVLEFARLEKEGVSLSRHVFNLNQVLQHVIDITLLKAAEKNLDVRVEWPDRAYDLNGDPVRLGQVLMHLLSNAVKFTDKGFVRLAVRVYRENALNQVQFIVQDSGIGMSQQQQDAMFQPFNQADNSLSRRHGGVGLGLSVTKRLIDEMGGELYVESQPEQGALFRFGLSFESAPEASEYSNTLESLRSDIAKLNPNARMLIYTTTAKAGETFSQALAIGGWRIETVTNTEQLVERLSHGGSYAAEFLVLAQSQTADHSKLRFSDLQRPLADCCRYVVAGPSWCAALGDHAQCLEMKTPLSAKALLETIHETLSSTKPQISIKKGEQPLAGARLLLVEDNRVNQELAKAVLEKFGAEVVVVNNGLQAVTLLEREEAFDVVLMDIQMPVMDGLEATRRIRQHDKLKLLPIIAVTAHVLEHDVQECYQAGMNGYLPKPFKASDLLDAIQDTVASI